MSLPNERMDNASLVDDDGEHAPDDSVPRHRHLTGSGNRCASRSPTEEEVGRAVEAEEEWLRAGGRRRNLAEVAYTVPIYFHIMQKGPTVAQGAFRQEWVTQSLVEVNKVFADSPFRFVLGGVDRVTKARWFNCKHDSQYRREYEYKKALRVPGKGNLNVYLCDLLNSQNAYGYSTFPPDVERWPVYDGILLANAPAAGYDIIETYMTLAHEIGHWLGGFHTWTGKCQRGKVDWYNGEHKSYIISGDGVRGKSLEGVELFILSLTHTRDNIDTPAHVGSTWTYTGWSNCFTKRKKPWNTCPDNKFGVDSGPDPVYNHLNYVESKCGMLYGHYTQGQLRRFSSQFELFRMSVSNTNVAGNNTSDSSGSGGNTANTCLIQTDCPSRLVCSKITGTGRCRTCHKRQTKCTGNNECCGNMKCKSGRCQ